MFHTIFVGCHQTDESSTATQEGAYYQWNLGDAWEQKPKYCQLPGQLLGYRWIMGKSWIMGNKYYTSQQKVPYVDQACFEILSKIDC